MKYVLKFLLLPLNRVHPLFQYFYGWLLEKGTQVSLKAAFDIICLSAKERFIKHLVYDENNFVQDNFSFTLPFIIDLKFWTNTSYRLNWHYDLQFFCFWKL